MNGLKTCTKCRCEKLLTYFGKGKGYKDGVRTWCKDCQNEYLRQWRQIEPDKYRQQNRKWHHNNRGKVRISQRKRLYGLSEEGFQLLFASQGCCCGVCGVVEPGSQGWCVDHDHVSKSVRGILCGRCNRGIGLLGDSLSAIKLVVSYLEKSNHES